MTVLEQRFMEYTVPELVRQMRAQNEQIKEQNELLKKIDQRLAKLTEREE